MDHRCAGNVSQQDPSGGQSHGVPLPRTVVPRPRQCAPSDEYFHIVVVVVDGGLGISPELDVFLTTAFC